MENQLNVTPLVVNLAISWAIFFVPAIITKKFFLPKEKPSGKRKAITIILLGIITLVICAALSIFLTGTIPKTTPWAIWMAIDYFYLFGWNQKPENAIDYDSLFAEMDEAEGNGSVPETKGTQLARDNIADDAVI